MDRRFFFFFVSGLLYFLLHALNVWSITSPVMMYTILLGHSIFSFSLPPFAYPHAFPPLFLEPLIKTELARFVHLAVFPVYMPRDDPHKTIDDSLNRQLLPSPTSFFPSLYISNGCPRFCT
jgi:hypothetical protein